MGGTRRVRDNIWRMTSKKKIKMKYCKENFLLLRLTFFADINARRGFEIIFQNQQRTWNTSFLWWNWDLCFWRHTLCQRTSVFVNGLFFSWNEASPYVSYDQKNLNRSNRNRSSVYTFFFVFGNSSYVEVTQIHKHPFIESINWPKS